MTRQTGLIPVTAAPMLDPSIGRVDMTMPAGATIAEIVAGALPGLHPDDMRFCRVALVSDRGSILIAYEHWHRIRPHEGVRVIIRLVPGKNAFRSILQIIVSIVAIAIGAYFAPILAGTFGIGAAGWQGLVALGVTVIGNLLINALIPPVKPETLRQENRYSIAGWQNRLEPDGAVPFTLGSVRYAPPFGLFSFTEIVGDIQYVRAVFCPGYGPLSLSGLRIGQTDLSEYDEVEVEIRQGLADDPPLSLVTKQVIEETVGAELLMPYPRDDLGNIIDGSSPEEDPVVRTTASDVTEASVILAWPSGLVSYNDKGDPRAHVVSIRIEQRRITDTAWSEVTTITVTARKLEAFYRQHTWKLPSRGRWQIRCTMLTGESTSSRVQQRVSWAALQSIRPEYPFNFPHPIALVAVRIKATYQLNGTLDNVNMLQQARCLDYEHTTQTWVQRETSNPASVYRYALQAVANPKRVSDAEIDVGALADWHDFCRIKGLKYDRVIDEPEMTLRGLLTEIAAAGRAAPRHDGIRWSVTVDRPDKQIIDHISPRNSYEFRATRSYVEPPDGFRVKFPDATNDYKIAERFVPWPGKENADIVLTEPLELPGKTDPAEIYREARRRMYEAIHRPDVYQVSKDGPINVATRGDRVRASTHVLDRVQIATRVKAVEGRLIELDERVTMEAGKDYAIRFITGLSEEDTIGTSIIRPVITMAGEHASLTAAPANTSDTIGQMPLAADLIHFGELSNVDFDLLVTGVEAGEDYSSHFRLVDMSPVIDEIIDAEVVPPWSGRVGAEIDTADLLPPAPRFTSIASGASGTIFSGRIDYLIIPGQGPVATARYQVRHRQTGATAWTTVTVPAASGGGSITTYINGTSVDIQARALSIDGTEGPYNSIVTFVVGAGDVALPVALDANAVSVGALLGGAVVQFSTSDDAATTRVQVYRSMSATLNREADAAGEPLAVTRSRSYSAPIGDTTRSNLVSNGDFSLDPGGWTKGAGFSISAGVAQRTNTGTVSTLWQAIAGLAGTSTFRISFELPTISGGGITAQLRSASAAVTAASSPRTTAGLFSGRLTATPSSERLYLRADETFAGSIDNVVLFKETATCLDIGTHYIWLEPQNDDGVAGPVSGPFAVVIR